MLWGSGGPRSAGSCYVYCTNRDALAPECATGYDWQPFAALCMAAVTKVHVQRKEQDPDSSLAVWQIHTVVESKEEVSLRFIAPQSPNVPCSRSDIRSILLASSGQFTATYQPEGQSQIFPRNDWESA